MSIRFQCSHCGNVTQVGDEYLGQSGPCVSCGQTVTVGTSEQPAPVGVPAKASNSSGSMVVMLTILGVVCGGLLIALLLPAVEPARGAARRMQCQNNLKQIALAMHNYHEVYQSFPPAYTVDDAGNKLHSWRTLILPFIDQSQLYSQIDLNRPWDSPQNRHLGQFVIPVYGCPSNEGPDPTRTNVMAIIGPGTVFEGSTPMAFKDIRDGTANTILVVEVRDSKINWMEPTDLDLDAMTMSINAGPSEIGNEHPGGAQVSLADGSIHFLAETLDPRTLRSLITRDGGEVIPSF